LAGFWRLFQVTSSRPGSSGNGWWFRSPTWLMIVLVCIAGSAILVVGFVAVSVVVQEVGGDVAVSQTTGGTDTTVTATASTPENESALAVGECLDGDELDNYLSGDDFFVKGCDAPHDYEVYFVHEFAYGSYPGDDEVFEGLQAECRGAFERYVARDYESSALNLWSAWPGRELWEDGNRVGDCLLFDTDGLTGSAYQSGW
jgi:hypothetical protein